MTTPHDIEKLTFSLSQLNITMPLEAIKPKSITGLDTLDFDKRNYVRWSETALDAYLYAGTHEYVLGQIPKPATDSADYPIWTKNDNIAQAGIRMNISSSERDYLRDHCTIASANDIWKETPSREGFHPNIAPR
jgi:hypothetical protein